MKSHSLNVLIVVSVFSLNACSQQSTTKSTIQPKPSTSTKTYYVETQKRQAQQVVFQRQPAKQQNSYRQATSQQQVRRPVVQKPRVVHQNHKHKTAKLLSFME